METQKNIFLYGKHTRLPRLLGFKWDGPMYVSVRNDSDITLVADTFTEEKEDMMVFRVNIRKPFKNEVNPECVDEIKATLRRIQEYVEESPSMEWNSRVIKINKSLKELIEKLEDSLR